MATKTAVRNGSESGTAAADDGRPEGGAGATDAAAANHDRSDRDGPGEDPPAPAPLGAYDAVVSAGVDVPVRRQLAAQIAGAIRAGRYGPGQRLPGARELGRRLGLHRETVLAAYAELSTRGLVRTRSGSGTYVAAELDPVAAAGGNAFRGFLARERAAGRTAAEVTELVDRWLDALGARRVVVVGDDGELLEVWEAEAREELAPLGVEVRACSLSDARREPSKLGAAAVAASPADLPEAAALAPRWAEVVPLAAGPDGGMRRLLLQLPRGAVTAVVSRSRALRREMGELAAALRGGDVAVAGLDPRREEPLERVLPVARFVLADVPSREAIRERVDGARLRTLRHLPRSGLRTLAAYLAG